MTILLSLTVFLNLVAETLPQVSDAIPLLGINPFMTCLFGYLLNTACSDSLCVMICVIVFGGRFIFETALVKDSRKFTGMFQFMLQVTTLKIDSLVSVTFYTLSDPTKCFYNFRIGMLLEVISVSIHLCSASFNFTKC